ncbi:hypothetical protein EJ03DRAFT_25681 [Teratosphaeria nubilosa]|uniref:Uncharacterized protein n=1 Tax=Teratosphaeria nubilosa TaxID=161662 RepID=A0A6G1KWN2_9PEZI|nr:hypothetical protein EJ03DRAFT_25681 [Teratosphaeria nubilosa]
MSGWRPDDISLAPEKQPMSFLERRAIQEAMSGWRRSTIWLAFDTVLSDKDTRWCCPSILWRCSTRKPGQHTVRMRHMKQCLGGGRTPRFLPFKQGCSFGSRDPPFTMSFNQPHHGCLGGGHHQSTCICSCDVRGPRHAQHNTQTRLLLECVSDVGAVAITTLSAPAASFHGAICGLWERKQQGCVGGGRYLAAAHRQCPQTRPDDNSCGSFRKRSGGGHHHIHLRALWLSRPWVATMRFAASDKPHDTPLA